MCYAPKPRNRIQSNCMRNQLPVMCTAHGESKIITVRYQTRLISVVDVVGPMNPYQPIPFHILSFAVFQSRILIYLSSTSTTNSIENDAREFLLRVRSNELFSLELIRLSSLWESAIIVVKFFSGVCNWRLSLEHMLTIVLPVMFSWNEQKYKQWNLSKVATQKEDLNWFSRPIYCLMQVKGISECSKGSILQYFQPLLRFDLSLRALFGLFCEATLDRLYCTLALHYVLYIKWFAMVLAIYNTVICNTSLKHVGMLCRNFLIRILCKIVPLKLVYL